MAVAVVGGAFLSATLQVLFDRLASREVVNLFSKRKTNVDGLLKKLKRKLLLLSVVLEDADVKQFTNKFVRAWSDEARDAVYQADDMLSDVAYEAWRREVESDPVYKTSTISSSFTSFDYHLEPKLKEIIKLLKDLVKEAGSLGLKEGVRDAHISTNRFPSESSSLVVESDVYGRELEKEELIKLLLSCNETSGADNDEVGVIAVVGMGGLGKTTLSQLAYNDVIVNAHFNDAKAWVCVSQEFDVLRVSKTILESITHCACRGSNLNQIQECLKEGLEGKKFLIVLDDVWNENYGQWDIFRTPFRNGAPGSKIIVTTRIQNAASIMTTGEVINLTELSDDDCWSMFSKIACGGRDHPLLEEIGRKIVKRCKGLPLAVKSLAGLLRSKSTPEEWDDVLKSELWDLPEDKSDILPSLRLSYLHLPSHLKQCFVFCSLFPKNYEFQEEELVLMWTAHKYVQPEGGKSYEMDGKKCFRELLSMSFFQKCAHGGSYFSMHDLIHDLAEVVSKQFSFRLDYDQKEDEIPIRARHFSFCPWRLNGQLQVAKEVNSLRTFLPIDNYGTWDSKVRLDDVLSTQRHMQVLSLRYYSGTNELLNVIGSLVHLHYLDLSYTDIVQLPNSVCKLHNLQTLLLLNCMHLTTLPVKIGKLSSLHRLDVRGTNLTEMPVQMSKLKGLQYLTKFVLGKTGGLGIEGLKAMSNLRGTLEISGLENVRASKDALEAKMKNIELLETLHLEWGWCGVTDSGSQYEIEVLDCLRPHTNLKELTISRYRGTRFADWLGDDLFSQMVSLHLEECNNCYELPPLGQLPCLKVLTVKGMRSVIEVGQEFYGSCAGRTCRPFPSLESLCFDSMPEWVEWNLPGIGEFPKLCRFEMIECPKLVGSLPECSGTIVISDCSSLKATVPTFLSTSPSSSSSSSSAAAFSSSLGAYSSPKYLLLRGSEKVEINWQGVMYGHFDELYISDVPSLKVLTSELFMLTKLKRLSVLKCPNLVSLSNMGLPPKLETLNIEECELLQSVVHGMVSFSDSGGLTSLLKCVKIRACPKLEFSVSEDIKRCCSSVEFLELYGGLARNLITLLNLFPNLRKLEIGPDDTSIASFLEHRELPNLTSFTICGCRKLVSRRSGWGLQRLPSLETLEMIDADESVESFPDVGLLPSTLTSLAIVGFPNMKRLNWRGFEHLTSLRSLCIGHCPKLELLPEEGLPSSIRELLIKDCPLLEPRCEKDKGEDWGKIAHIPHITADIFEYRNTSNMIFQRLSGK